MKYPYAAKVKAMRKERAWTQEELAKVSGLDVRTVQRIESGARPSLQSLRAIAATFDIDVKELYETASTPYLSQECSLILSMSPDYWHEDSLRLEKRLEDLRQERNRAEQEAQHARNLHFDMQGPIEAAEAEVECLSIQISCVERLVQRVKAGFPYLERRGFEEAIDACGEVSSWEVLSEAPTPGTIMGHDDAVIRLPTDVQKSYAQAVSTHLFEKFEVCLCFESPDDAYEKVPQNEIRQYLFGTIQSPNTENEESAIFLIAQW